MQQQLKDLDRIVKLSKTKKTILRSKFSVHPSVQSSPRQCKKNSATFVGFSKMQEQEEVESQGQLSLFRSRGTLAPAHQRHSHESEMLTKMTHENKLLKARLYQKEGDSWLNEYARALVGLVEYLTKQLDRFQAAQGVTSMGQLHRVQKPRLLKVIQEHQRDKAKLLKNMSCLIKESKLMQEQLQAARLKLNAPQLRLKRKSSVRQSFLISESSKTKPSLRSSLVGRSKDCKSQSLFSRNQSSSVVLANARQFWESTDQAKKAEDSKGGKTTPQVEQILSFITYRAKSKGYSSVFLMQSLLRDQEQTVAQVAQSLRAEPFALNSKYEGTMLKYLFGKEETLDARELRRLMLSKVNLSVRRRDFRSTEKRVEFVLRENEEELLQQLGDCESGEGTVRFRDFVRVMRQFGLSDDETIQHMVEEVILDSPSMQELNYFVLFQRFLRGSQLAE